MPSKLTQAEKLRRAGWDEAAELAVTLLQMHYDGFKGKVSYLIAAEVLRADLAEMKRALLAPKRKKRGQGEGGVRIDRRPIPPSRPQ